MKPAVFLDKDGVLTVENFKITHPAEVVIMPFAFSCVQRLHELGYLALVITNQSGIARGLFSIEDLERSHNILKQKTGVDEIFYCPHYPNGKIKEFSFKCECRKPSIGLIQQALNKYEIDICNSYVVGDRAADILTGKNAGIKTVLLESGYGRKNLEQDIEADFYFQDLREFTNFLTKIKRGI